MKQMRLSFMVTIITFFVSVVYAQSGTLTVEVSDIDEVKGLLSVGLYANKKNFPDKGRELKGTMVKITGKTVTARLFDVPAGVYAVAVFHDSNSNTELDKNFLNIPSEGYAFSNNVSAIGIPAYKDASFKFSGDMTIKINMIY